jgi:hypothetical protein
MLAGPRSPWIVVRWHAMKRIDAVVDEAIDDRNGFSP